MIMVSKTAKVGGLEARLFEIRNEEEFNALALEVFRFQYENNPLYQRFCMLVNRHPGNVLSTYQIPFLPIVFFKSQRVQTTLFTPEEVFKSSGTTGVESSHHAVRKRALYEKSFSVAFELMYGDPAKFCFLALLPSYLERGDSSLVFMVQGLMDKSRHDLNNFYLHNHAALAEAIAVLEEEGQPTILIGVTYALLDFATLYPRSLRHTTVIETGGMKGRKKELVRPEVHQLLGDAFDLPSVHSEYGMTELLSQAYARGGGRFETPPWMKALLRSEDDPMNLETVINKPASGTLNIIDLANLYSCSFIATEDAGRLYPDGTFEVLGRMDYSDVRGCSLMAPGREL